MECWERRRPLILTFSHWEKEWCLARAGVWLSREEMRRWVKAGNQALTEGVSFSQEGSGKELPGWAGAEMVGWIESGIKRHKAAQAKRDIYGNPSPPHKKRRIYAHICAYC